MYEVVILFLYTSYQKKVMIYWIYVELSQGCNIIIDKITDFNSMLTLDTYNYRINSTKRT